MRLKYSITACRAMCTLERGIKHIGSIWSRVTCLALPRDDTLLKVSTTDPWYTNIINYIMAGYIPPGSDKKRII
jgi:hypothetical protein